MLHHKLLACCCIASVFNMAMAAESPRHASGVYPFVPGVYVAPGTDCATPANAAVRVYDGKGIGTAHTHACVARILSQHDGRFSVNQTCIDRGEGEGKRFAQDQQIVVINSEAFAQSTGGASTNYHYCPVSTLPPDLQRIAQPTN